MIDNFCEMIEQPKWDYDNTWVKDTTQAITDIKYEFFRYDVLFYL